MININHRNGETALIQLWIWSAALHYVVSCLYNIFFMEEKALFSAGLIIRTLFATVVQKWGELWGSHVFILSQKDMDVLHKLSFYQSWSVSCRGAFFAVTNMSHCHPHSFSPHISVLSQILQSLRVSRRGIALSWTKAEAGTGSHPSQRLIHQIER